MTLSRKHFPGLLYLPILVFVFISISCEDVINVDLNSSAPSLVADGALVQDSAGWIKLSYTSDYFSISKPAWVEDAKVILSEDSGNDELFVYKGNGLYRGNNLKGKPNRNYTINISNKSFNFTAISYLVPAPVIYSVKFKESPFQFPGEPGKGYTIDLKFSDDTLSENYYNIDFLINSEPDEENYILIEDNFFSKGDTTYFAPRWKLFGKGDSVTVRITSFDKNTFGYFNQLNDLLQSGMGGPTTPYNPLSNFGSSVMGYFRAYSSKSVTSVVR